MKKQILDHGYLEFVESWGSDEAVIRAARMSTDKGFRSWSAYYECRKCLSYTPMVEGREPYPPQGCEGAPAPDYFHDWRDVPKGDAGLLRYLWENRHSTPFEFGGLTIEVQAPIAVFREWHRHRVPFGYSELSARYTPMPNLNYLPTVERCMLGGGRVTKQAGAAAGASELTKSQAQYWLTMLWELYQQAEHCYQTGLELGVPKELARGAVTVFRYSRMRATGNLRGWLAFCQLRCAPTAQWEIRQYADAVLALLEEKFPRTVELYQDGERKAAEEKNAVKKLALIRKLAEDFHDTYYRDQLLELLDRG